MEYLSQLFPNEQVCANVVQILSHIYKGLNTDPMQHKIYVLQGSGGNGKTTFLNMIENIMGSKCFRLTNTHKLNCQSIVDKRLAICETDGKSIGWLRQYVDGNLVFTSSWERTNFDIIVVSNETIEHPRLVEVIQFENRFVPNPDVNDPHQQKAESLDVLLNKWKNPLVDLLSH